MDLLDRLVLQWDILGLGPEPEVSSEGKKARDLSRFHSTTRWKAGTRAMFGTRCSRRDDWKLKRVTDQTFSVADNDKGPPL